MILSAIVEKLKRRSKDDFKGRHFEATLIIQAVSWYLRYPLSYRDIEVVFSWSAAWRWDHSTLNRWVLAYAPLIERRLRAFRKPHCGPGCGNGGWVGPRPIGADPVGGEQRLVFQRLAEEALGGLQVALRGEQEVDRVSVLVDGPVQVAPLAADLDVCLVDPD